MVLENVFRICPERTVFAEGVREHFGQILLNRKPTALGMLRDGLGTRKHLRAARAPEFQFQGRDAVHLRVLLAAMRIHLIRSIA